MVREFGAAVLFAGGLGACPGSAGSRLQTGLDGLAGGGVWMAGHLP